MKPNGYWTKDKILTAAKECSNRTEFRKRYSGAYQVANKKGWLDEACDHMNSRRDSWSLEELQAVANKYECRSDFRKNDHLAYDSARKKKLLDKICGHMVNDLARVSLEFVVAEARKSKTRSEFRKASPRAYHAAHRNEWLNLPEVTGHMESKSNGYYHCIYAITNKRLNKAYIGVTCKPVQERITGHRSKRSGCNAKEIIHEQDTTWKKLTDYVYSPSDIKDGIERDFALSYKDAGFELLNNNQAFGCIGYQKRIWTKDKVKPIALKYKTRLAFEKGDKAAYGAAHKYGWLDEVCAHMDSKYWTLGELKVAAAIYGTKASFERGNKSAYQSAQRRGLLDKICGHMVAFYRTWDLESVKKVALTFDLITDFAKRARGAYGWAKKNKMLKVVCAHMKKPVKWCHSSVAIEAQKHPDKPSFRKAAKGAYNYAERHNILAEVCSHMDRPTKKAA